MAGLFLVSVCVAPTCARENSNATPSDDVSWKFVSDTVSPAVSVENCTTMPEPLRACVRREKREVEEDGEMERWREKTEIQLEKFFFVFFFFFCC